MPAVGVFVAADARGGVDLDDRAHHGGADEGEAVAVAIGNVEMAHRRQFADLFERMGVEAIAGALAILVERAQHEALGAG